MCFQQFTKIYDLFEYQSWFAQYLLLVLLRVGQPPPELRVPALHLADPLPHAGVLPVAPLVRRPALLQLHPRLLVLDLGRESVKQTIYILQADQ